MGVIPTLGKGTLGTWRFHRATRRSDTELAQSRRGNGTRLWANRGSRGVCEPALKPLPSWEGPWKKGQGFKPDPGNPAVRHYRGGLGKRGHGGIVNPPRNRKGEAGNPPPVIRRVRALSQPQPGPFPLFLGGEERLKDVRARLCIHPAQ
jgi:hypothetical protein